MAYIPCKQGMSHQDFQNVWTDLGSKMPTLLQSTRLRNIKERIVRNKFGTIAVLIFSALLGCQLFVYITENRLLRKQVYKLTESLEDVLEKQYNLEQDHTECLTMHKRTFQEKDKMTDKLGNCNENAEKLEKARKVLAADHSDLQAELDAAYDTVQTLMDDNDNFIWKNNLAAIRKEELEKASEKERVYWGGKLENCQQTLKLCGADATASTSEPTEVTEPL